MNVHTAVSVLPQEVLSAALMWDQMSWNMFCVFYSYCLMLFRLKHSFMFSITYMNWGNKIFFDKTRSNLWIFLHCDTSHRFRKWRHEWEVHQNKSVQMISDYLTLYWTSVRLWAGLYPVSTPPPRQGAVESPPLPAKTRACAQTLTRKCSW